MRPRSKIKALENRTPDLQREVQRLLGRCLLQIQQYERLVKAMLSRHALAGPASSFEALQRDRVESFSRFTLGALVGALFKDLVVPAGRNERDLFSEDEEPADETCMAFRSIISMTPEQWTQTRAAIKELVAMRNEFVHHLIEQFDLGTEKGCVSAARHLEKCYCSIDRHLRHLVDWTKTMHDANQMIAAFIQSEAGRDLIENGIAPDGQFEWSSTGIVCVLREAFQFFAQDGWARLDQVRAWIVTAHPEQVPEKYGCRSWPQVLSESRLFELQYRPDEDRRKIAWFRSRT